MAVDWVPTSIASRKPFSSDGGTLWTRDIICIHTMVGSLAGSWSWASSQGTVWHFGTSGTGECWQCLPLDRRSGANLHGNHRVVAIENADHGPGFGPWNGQCGHVPSFTPAQLDKLVQLVAWLCVSLNIPPVLIPDTRPGRRGIAYHRQGIDPYRCGSCEMWSRAKGKCCPDNARIHQLVNVIIPRVRAIVAGDPQPKPEPPKKKEEYVMPYDVIHCKERGPEYFVLTPSGAKPVPGGSKAFEFYTVGVAQGLLKPVKELSMRAFDVTKALCNGLA